MGYEIRLHLGTKYSSLGFSEVAQIDLCKPGNVKFLDLRREGNKIQQKLREIGIYKGDVLVFEDAYEEKLQAIGATVFLEALKQDCEESKKEYNGNMYRRFELALVLLEVFVERFKGENPVVVMYGY